MERHEEVTRPGEVIQTFSYKGKTCRVQTRQPWADLLDHQRDEVEGIALRWFNCALHTDLKDE